MEKRGQTETLWMLVSIIGAVLIAYVLASIGSEYGTGKIFLKSRVAKELVFEIDAFYSIPGDVYIINKNDYNFSFKFGKDKVKVFEYYNKLVGTADYEFVKSGDEKIEYDFKNPKQLVISKINHKITITEEVPDFFLGITKKEPDFKNKKILIYYGDVKSEDIVNSINILNSNYKTFLNFDYGGYDKNKIIDSDVIIGISSKTDETDNKVSIYINKKSLKNLESLSLANALSNKIKNIIKEIEVVSLEEIDENKRDILDNDKIAVYIEFPETKEMVELANAVYGSLEMYSK